MEIKTINVNGKEYQFVNESGNTRNGFYHRSTLFRNGYEVRNHRVSYLNRTWECYRYQTCMMGLVNAMKNDRIDRLTNDYKVNNNYSKLTAKRKAELQTIIEADALCKEYDEVYDKLRH